MRRKGRKPSQRAREAEAEVNRLRALLDQRTTEVQAMYLAGVGARQERDAARALLADAEDCLTSLLRGPTAGDLDILLKQMESYRRQAGYGSSNGLAECRAAWAGYGEARRRANELLQRNRGGDEE